MRASRLCSLWSSVRPLRFQRIPFRRDVIFNPGGATAPRITVPHMLPSTLVTGSASATLGISRLNLTPQQIAVYASQSPSPTPTQHSLPGGPLRPYPCRSSTGWNTPASPDAPQAPLHLGSQTAAPHPAPPRGRCCAKFCNNLADVPLNTRSGRARLSIADRKKHLNDVSLVRRRPRPQLSRPLPEPARARCGWVWRTHRPPSSRKATGLRRVFDCVPSFTNTSDNSHNTMFRLKLISCYLRTI
jgi:hypothetical protein